MHGSGTTDDRTTSQSSFRRRSESRVLEYRRGPGLRRDDGFWKKLSCALMRVPCMKRAPQRLIAVCFLVLAQMAAADETCDPSASLVDRQLCLSPALRDLDSVVMAAASEAGVGTLETGWRTALHDGCRDDHDCLFAGYFEKLATLQHEALEQDRQALAESPPPAHQELTLRGARSVKTPEEIFELASRSIVTIGAYGKKLLVLDRVSFGSGVTINAGKVATNCHVVAGMESISIAHDGRRYAAVTLLAQPSADVCILHVPGLPTQSVELGALDEVRPGQRVFVLGNPMNLGLSITDGLLSGIVEPGRIPGVAIDSKLLQFDAPTWPGNSGGGLFDEQGRVIGVPSVRWTPKNQETMNFAVPLADVGIVRKLLGTQPAH